MLRITTGTLKGMGLTVPKHLRATGGKIRQALFNILGPVVVGARVLDGFAGSGALGLEALSRGAARAVFLEGDLACLEAIQANVAKVPPGALEGTWAVIRGDVLRSLKVLARGGETFDVVLLDPPYEGFYGKKALNVVAGCGILAPAGLVCLEHSRRSPVPSEVGTLTVRTQHRYGETVLSFYQTDASRLSRDL